MIFICSVLYSRCGSFVIIYSGIFAWYRWSAWEDVSNWNAQCTCACGTQAEGSTVRSAVAVGDEMAAIRSRCAGRIVMRQLLIVRQAPENRHQLSARQTPCLVRCRDVWVSGDVVTPFWTVTDNPTPFCGLRQITPSDTELAVVLMCWKVWPFLMLLLVALSESWCC